jgi:hypothetical protein
VRELESFRSGSKTPLGLWLLLGLWSGLDERLAESLDPMVPESSRNPAKGCRPKTFLIPALRPWP